MSSPTTKRTVLGLGLAAVAAGTLASSATAAPVDITDAKFGWTQYNAYDSASGKITFLGHATDPTPGRGSAGTVSIAGAGTGLFDGSGASVTAVEKTSPRGATTTYAFVFPATGTYDAETGALELSGTGTVTFDRYTWSTLRHAVTVENPRLVWNTTTNTGSVYASGISAPQSRSSTVGSPYDASTPVWSVTGQAAAATPAADALPAIPASTLVPTLARGGVFDTTYAPGVSGPDRDPNNWGGFGVAYKLPVPQAPAPQTPAPQAPAPQTLPPAATTEKLTITLAKQPFKAKRAISVQIRKRGEWTILGDGSVKGRTLTLTVKTGTKLSGDYVLRRTSKSSILPKSKVVAVK